MLEVTQRPSEPEAEVLPAPEPRPLRLHVLRFAPMVIVLGLLVHFLLPRLDTIEDSLQTARTLAPWAIALAVIAEVMSYIANGSLLQSVVCLAGEEIPLKRATAIEIAAATVALVAAGALGFGAAIYKWTRDSGVSKDTAVLASWMAPVFDSITLIVFALLGAIELLLVHRLSRATVIALSIVLSLLTVAIAGVIVLLARSDWMMAIATRVSRLLKKLRPKWDERVLIDAADRAATTWKSMRRGGWIRPLCNSLGVLTFDALCLWCVFLAAGHHVHVTMLIAGYGVPVLLGRTSFLPGGIAVIEVAMAALFGALGVLPNVAVVVVLTYRLISFWIPAMIGIPIAIALQSRKRRVAA